jgi:hypothetical protein
MARVTAGDCKLRDNDREDTVKQDDLDAEHEALKRQVAELRREHEYLRQNPHDIAGHEAHRHKLEQKLVELREHKAKLKPDA